MEAACHVTSQPSAAAAVNAFALRPAAFHKIVGADVHEDCLHLFNANGEPFVLNGVGLTIKPGLTMKILSAAGFSRAVDNAGHSLVSMVQLGCCGGAKFLSFSKLDGSITVAHLA